MQEFLNSMESLLKLKKFEGSLLTFQIFLKISLSKYFFNNLEAIEEFLDEVHDLAPGHLKTKFYAYQRYYVDRTKSRKTPGRWRDGRKNDILRGEKMKYWKENIIFENLNDFIQKYLYGEVMH